MPYFVSDEQDDCDGWATIKIDDDGTIETVGCHETMNDAVAQMIAISLDEGVDPGGELSAKRSAPRNVHTKRREELNNVREVREWHLSNIELREADDSDTVTFSGYATVFDADYVVHDAFGEFTERIAPGAFSQTLSQTPDVILNVNHGAGGGLPLARTKSGTLSLVQDSVGLRVEARLDRNDPDVQSLLPKMRRGDVDEMSFAFRVTAQSWSDNYAERSIEAVNLHRGDVSIVSFGANPATMAMVRSALADDDVRSQLLAELDLGTDAEPAADDVNVTAEVDAEATEPSVEVDAERSEDVHCQESVPTVAYYLSQLLERSA
jgi:HK97 family phage prohead protease